MAELALSSGKSGGRNTGKLPVRVDLTALVDLAFLLITFFMLTTTLSKPKNLPLVMPDPGPLFAVGQSSTMTICLGKSQALCYLGMADKPLMAPKLVSFGINLQQAIQQMARQVFAKTGKSLMVVVKPSQHSVYKNLVNTLDELNITQTSRYAIAAIAPADIDMLKKRGVY